MDLVFTWGAQSAIKGELPILETNEKFFLSILTSHHASLVIISKINFAERKAEESMDRLGPLNVKIRLLGLVTSLCQEFILISTVKSRLCEKDR